MWKPNNQNTTFTSLSVVTWRKHFLSNSQQFNYCLVNVIACNLLPKHNALVFHLQSPPSDDQITQIWLNYLYCHTRVSYLGATMFISITPCDIGWISDNSIERISSDRKDGRKRIVSDINQLWGKRFTRFKAGREHLNWSRRRIQLVFDCTFMFSELVVGLKPRCIINIIWLESDPEEVPVWLDLFFLVILSGSTETPHLAVF